MAVGVPKLRLLVGGVLIEGVQVPLEELPATDQGGAAELVRFLGGARRVLVLRQPLIYRGLDGAGEPTFEYTGQFTETFRSDVNLLSRWRAQFGVRYTFN